MAFLSPKRPNRRPIGVLRKPYRTHHNVPLWPALVACSRADTLPSLCSDAPLSEWHRPTGKGCVSYLSLSQTQSRGSEQSYELLLLLHSFNSLFSRTTWVSRYQKGKISLDINKARDYGVLGWQWHQVDHMQTICTSLQTDNHTNTSSVNFYRPDAQQCQSTEQSYEVQLKIWYVL